VAEQDVEIVGVEPGLLGWRVEQEGWVLDHVPVDRTTSCDQDRDARPQAATGPTHLLPGGRDGTGVAGEYRDVELAYVDAQL
jgi:hypothetical protein